MKARQTSLFTSLFTVLLLVFSGNLFAVGLGELKVISGLNEPLVARIDLVKVGDLTENEMMVKLGSAEDFAQRNMSRDFIYTKFRFAIDLQDKAHPHILVTTSEAIKEPSLDFLVQLEWPSGKLLRGYTVLLEKP